MPEGIRLGLLAYSTNTGLGIQTWEFANHLHPERVMHLDLSALNGMEQHPERYEGDVVWVKGIPSFRDINTFLQGLDIVFVCETPLNYQLFSRARELGVKTILQPNHEFNDYLNRPSLPPPDLFALPSLWHWDDLQVQNKVYLRVPVADEKLPLNVVTGFRRFLHIAGRVAINDRNGTIDTIEAFKAADCPDATLTIRIQEARELEGLTSDDQRIAIDGSEAGDYAGLYVGYDCLLLPRKYGGLCLPMQEALACGMPVIMTDTAPNDSILPADWLLPCELAGSFRARTDIDLYQVDRGALTAMIEHLYGLDEDCAARESDRARSFGRAASWSEMDAEYLDVFRDLLA